MLLNTPSSLVDYDKLKSDIRAIQTSDDAGKQVALANLPETTGDQFLDGKLEQLRYLAGPTGQVASEGDGNMADVIKEINAYIQGQEQKESAANCFNWTRYAAKLETETSPASKKKKKTKANPFRVLMGMVGKLLDHGVPKPTIVRHVAKNTQFDEQTVDRCVDIVRNYNKKKTRVDEEVEMAGPSDNDSKETQDEPGKKELEASFNYERWVESQRKSGTARDLYDAEPQWEKRSTAELFARLQWLHSLMGYGADTAMGDQRKAADKQGANGQIAKINGELERRGFNNEEITSLLTVRDARKD
ncbi:MAG: hypothetical protein JSS66_05165 [Armatimonadetes bacterium]|nr:hypothetical protein [Armatimonadota bacterium]